MVGNHKMKFNQLINQYAKINEDTEYTVYSQIEDLEEAIIQKRITIPQLIDQLKNIKEEILDISEKLRQSGANEIANQLVD